MLLTSIVRSLSGIAFRRIAELVGGRPLGITRLDVSLDGMMQLCCARGVPVMTA
ncbi:hypothetical protein [Verrucosispora sp. WMMD573]|uniref:hypothetical protein n=1 Tax=Verrucosispora sp. WMMD573 TaxID=3015149 RepID=UPI00248C80E9|nr:hypothetical protein [Verrucosispora sp. WMMD573]WBB55669.1 hypothetical protein O7601_06090 [Verrucosispora sp. WMMD573]